ncbi:MAG: hypothetical protein ABH859_00305 [Pseudomonadota bacterium]
MKIILKIILIVLLSCNCLAAVSDQQKKRDDLVAEELKKYKHKEIKYDASDLSAKDQAFLKRMLKAAQIVEEINMLQLNPHNLEYQKEVQNVGSRKDKILFHRNQSCWCSENQDVLCNACPGLPDRKIGWDFWPDDMNENLLKDFEKLPNASALLSPFTYVKADKFKKYSAIPFASYPLIADQIKRLADVLRLAATDAQDLTLKKFLRSRARAMEAKQAFSYDSSDLDWIGLQGPWELTIGPYETYKEPFKHKAQFEMYLGRIHPEVTKKLNVYKKYLQDFENHFANFVGKELYKPRKLDKGVVIRAIDVIYAAGDGRSAHGATVAYHLPNRGRAIEKGLSKKVLLVNHMQLFGPLMKKRAKVSLVKDQVALVQEWSDIMNTTFHEFAHGLGAHEELKIRDVKGRQTTVSQALGSMETLMEELKADVASQWFVPYLVKQGLLKPEEVNSRYATAVQHLFGLIQYSLKGTYAQMAAVELGNLMDYGVLRYDQEEEKFDINFEKYHGAVEQLLKRVATIQLTGDKDGAQALRDQYVKKDKGDQYQLLSPLNDFIAQLKQAFEDEKLKSYAIDYKVKF